VTDSVARNYGAQTSLIGALGLGGLVATMSLEGAVDRPAFNAYLDQVLGPKLLAGDVVILDNLNVDKVSQGEQLAASRGAAVVWLAPYSPDYSPIEQYWSKIKQALRAAKARRREELEAALAFCRPALKSGPGGSRSRLQPKRQSNLSRDNRA
jgi:transposase